MNFDAKSLDDLKKDLESAIKLYPDMAERKLAKVANQFKKDVIGTTKERVNVDEERRKGLIKGYRLGPMKSFGVNMHREFRATSPHFHLIEHGHEKVTKGGETIGFVPGRHMVRDEREKLAEKMPNEATEMIDSILKKVKL